MDVEERLANLEKELEGVKNANMWLAKLIKEHHHKIPVPTIYPNIFAEKETTQAILASFLEA